MRNRCQLQLRDDDSGDDAFDGSAIVGADPVAGCRRGVGDHGRGDVVHYQAEVVGHGCVPSLEGWVQFAPIALVHDCAGIALRHCYSAVQEIH